MTPYPDLQVRFRPQKGQLSFQGFDLSGQGLVLFFLPHSSVRDLSPGTNAAAQHRQQKPWATTSPSKLLSHSGIEIWLLDGKQKTLTLTTTPKSASAALGTFPRVSRTGSQQAELFGGNGTSYLTPLCDYHKDTGMVRASSHPPWGQCSVSCSDCEEITSWQKSVTQRSIRQLCPKFSMGPRVEIPHTEQKFTSKTLQQIQTNKQKSTSVADVFRAFTRQEWGSQTGLGLVFVSKLPNNFAFQPWCCTGLSFQGIDKFFSPKLCCGENLLFQLVQMQAAIRQNCSMLQWHRENAKKEG